MNQLKKDNIRFQEEVKVARLKEEKATKECFIHSRHLNEVKIQFFALKSYHTDQKEDTGERNTVETSFEDCVPGNNRS